MPTDADHEVERALAECERSVSDFRILWIVLILALLVLLAMISAATIYLKNNWVPFDQGIVSVDPLDYPAASAEIRVYFPSEARFLPTAIPSTATAIVFDCSTIGAMQASPRLNLDFDLPPTAAQAELARLRSLQPTDVTHTGYIFSSQSAQYAFAEDLIVLGFLTKFVPNYRAGLSSAPERIAFVTYDPSTGHFHYEFNSD